MRTALVRSRAVGAALLAVLAAPSEMSSGQQAGAGRATVLAVSLGPRSGTWKRSFNPFRDDTDSRWPARAGIYEPLLVYNRAIGSYVPWLATAYRWGAGDRTLRFQVRSGVVWSDDAPFSSADVAFTFNLMRRVPALDRHGVWSFLADVKALDATTVEFTFKQPHTPGLFHVGTQPIVAEHVWKDVAQPATFDDPRPVGTGPFVEVRRFEPTVYELGRNPKYWQKGKPAVDLLRVPLHRSNDEILRALAAGELDWASVFVADVEKRWVALNPARHLYWFPDHGPTVLLQVNTQRPPFGRSEVRKALSMAIDRPRIAREAMNGHALPADATGIAESQKAWKDAGLAQAGHWTRRDVAEANRLLDAAGLERRDGGVRVSPGGGAMRYDLQVVDGWSDWIAAAGIIRENLAEVGVELTVKPRSYEEWYGAQEQGRFDAVLRFGDRGATPYEFYRGQMDATLVRPIGEKAVGNFHRFSSAEAGGLLGRFAASSDPAEQGRACRQLQQLFVEHAPGLPLFAAPLWGVFDATRITGFPSRYNPYGVAVPGSENSDALPVLLGVKPR